MNKNDNKSIKRQQNMNPRRKRQHDWTKGRKIKKKIIKEPEIVKGQ